MPQTFHHCSELRVTESQAVLLGGGAHLEQGRIGVAPAVRQARPLGVGGGPGEGALDEGDRLLEPTRVDEEGAIADGLGAAVDVLRRQGRQLLQVIGSAAEAGGRYAFAANGQGETARRGLHQVPVDVQVVAEAFVQELVELPDGDSGLRHLDLHVRRPGAPGVQGLDRGPGGLLQLAQGVQHVRSDHFAGDSAAGQHRRRLERVHHHRAGGEGVGQHDQDAYDDQNGDYRGQPLHQQSQTLTGSAELAFPALVDQVREPVLALLDQLLGLQLQQMRLTLEEALGGARDGRIAGGMLRGEGGGEGFGAGPLGRIEAALRRLLGFAEQFTKHPFRHDAPPETSAASPCHKRGRSKAAGAQRLSGISARSLASRSQRPPQAITPM